MISSLGCNATNDDDTLAATHFAVNEHNAYLTIHPMACAQDKVQVPRTGRYATTSQPDT